MKNNPPAITPLLVDVPALLKMLSIGRSKFYEAVSSGQFGPQPITVFGKKRLYRFEDVRRWVAESCPPSEKFLKGIEL